MTSDVLTEPGVVAPAFCYRPPRVRSLLPKVDKVCKLLGESLEPEQAETVDVLTGLKDDGSPASLEAAVICARQNLKTHCLERIVLTRLLDPHDSAKLIIWTAQQLDTSQQTFLHFKAWFESEDLPFLGRRLVRITSGNGSEAIELVGGKRLKFKARSKRAGQGLTGDVVVFDEAFALEPAHMAALLPTLSTRRRAAVFYGSSAGHVESEVLRSVRDRGRRQTSGSPAYVEFCAPGSWDQPGCEIPGCRHTWDMPGCALDRQDLVQLANPMAGRRITWEYLGNERRAMPPHMFGRERLGWWDQPDKTAFRPISDDVWSATALDAPRRTLRDPVFFLTIGKDMSSATVAVAASQGGVPHVELAAHDRGVHWLPGRVRELHSRYPASTFAAYSAGPVKSLAPELALDGIELRQVTQVETASACAHLQKLADARGFTHSPDVTLATSLHGARKRDLDGGGWVWDWKSSEGDLAPLAAVTGALWLLELVPSGEPGVYAF